MQTLSENCDRRNHRNKQISLKPSTPYKNGPGNPRDIYSKIYSPWAETI